MGGFLLAATLLHCAGSDSATSGASAPDAAAPSTGDAGNHAADGGARDGGCGTTDDPDDDGIDSNCDGADGVVGRDVYVDVNAGSDTNAGTPSQPLRTLKAALPMAVTLGPSAHVLVAAGTYAIDGPFALAGTWSAYGGYHGGFTGAPKRDLTILTTGESGLMLDVADHVTLAHLTVQAASAGDPTQPHAHGIRSKVVALRLDDVVVRAGDGASMPVAKKGDMGAMGIVRGPLVCDGVTEPAYTNGASVGSSPEGKPAGDFAAKRPAASGSDGTPGSDGRDAHGTLSMANDLVTADRGEPGHADGRPGFGGAAGGGTTTWAPANGPVYGGAGGSGGCPGHGGDGGATGGASIALIALQGAITVTRSELDTGAGGNGGDGGDGGPGGLGALGGGPSVNGVPYDPGCGIASDPMGANCAAWGGNGGNGGAGGHGGGGAGGSVYAVMTIGAATVTLDAATTTRLGQTGLGGKGNGGGRAPNGARAQTIHVD